MSTKLLKDKFEEDLYKNVIKMSKLDNFNGLTSILAEKGYFKGARSLINNETRRGFKKLMRLNRPDLTIEYLVVQAKYKNLFEEEEIDLCNKRLGN